MNQSSSKIWIVAVLVILIAGGILAWQYFGIPKTVTPTLPSTPAVRPSPTPTPTPDETANWKTYRNEKYGFEIRYPQDYFLEEVTKEFILLRREKDKEFDWKIEVNIKGDFEIYNEAEKKYESTSNLSFEEFAIRQIRKNCVADGPTGSIYCTDVRKIEPFKNKGGLEGYLIFITQVHEIYDSFKPTRKIKEIVKGPVFALDISQQTHGLARGLFFEPEESEEKEEFVKTINQILSTFRFLE